MSSWVWPDVLRKRLYAFSVGNDWSLVRSNCA